METYTFNDLKQKYGWNSYPNQDRMIEFALSHGVKIEKAETKHKKMAKFYIIDDNIANANWVVCSMTPNYEVCKEGFIRNIKNKRIWTAMRQEYISVTDNLTGKHYLGHRMIMETFNPIENSQDYIVDHINGVKTDNRLENLRWISAKGNQMAKIENWDLMAQPFQELLQLAGYEKVIEILEENIKKFKKK